MAGRHRSTRAPFGKEARWARRRHHRQIRYAARRAIRRGDEPARTRKTEGWISW
jgi:hypothetical protein